MAGRSIEAGRAFMRLFVDDSEFRRGLTTAGNRLKAFGQSFTALGATIGGIGAAIGAPFALAVKSASDAQETLSKFNVVFGELSEGAKQFGDELAGQIGRSKSEIAGFLAGFQDLLVPIGIDPKRAAETSKQLTQLAADLASFNNKADADVVRDLQAALTGSSEVMKKYGVIVNQAAVSQQLLAEGIDPKTATETEKVFARFNIILEGTTAAQGDALRTAGSFANRMKALRSQVKDLADEVGAVLLPAATSLLATASRVVKVVGNFASENKALIVTLAGASAALVAIGGSLVSIGIVASTAGGAITALTAATTALSGALAFLAANPLVAILTALGAVVAGAIAYSQAMKAVATETKSVAEEMDNLNKKIGQFQKTTSAVGSAIDEAANKFQVFQTGQTLTTEQIVAQAKVVRQLEKTYGSLAFTYDDTTHAIDNFSEVLGKLSAKEQKAAARDEFKRSLLAIRGEAKYLEAEFINLTNAREKFSRLANIGADRDNQLATILKDIERVREQYEALGQRKVELRAEFNATIKGIEEAGKRTVEVTAADVEKTANAIGQKFGELSSVLAEGPKALDAALQKIAESATRSAEAIEREKALREQLTAARQHLQDQLAALRINTDPNKDELEKRFAQIDLQADQDKRRLQEQGVLTPELKKLLDGRSDLLKEQAKQNAERFKGIPEGLSKAADAVSKGTFSGRAAASGSLSPADVDKEQLKALLTGNETLEKINREQKRDNKQVI